jgi:hypothetical protein
MNGYGSARNKTRFITTADRDETALILHKGDE